MMMDATSSKSHRNLCYMDISLVNANLAQQVVNSALAAVDHVHLERVGDLIDSVVDYPGSTDEVYK